MEFVTAHAVYAKKQNAKCISTYKLHVLNLHERTMYAFEIHVHTCTMYFYVQTIGTCTKSCTKQEKMPKKHIQCLSQAKKLKCLSIDVQCICLYKHVLSHVQCLSCTCGTQVL